LAIFEGDEDFGCLGIVWVGAGGSGGLKGGVSLGSARLSGQSHREPVRFAAGVETYWKECCCDGRFSTFVQTRPHQTEQEGK
jgi:hypothetical protein